MLTTAAKRGGGTLDLYTASTATRPLFRPGFAPRLCLGLGRAVRFQDQHLQHDPHGGHPAPVWFFDLRVFLRT